VFTARFALSPYIKQTNVTGLTAWYACRRFNALFVTYDAPGEIWRTNTTKTHWEVEVYLHAFSTLALDTSAVNITFWPLYPSRKKPRFSLERLTGWTSVLVCKQRGKRNHFKTAGFCDVLKRITFIGRLMHSIV